MKRLEKLTDETMNETNQRRVFNSIIVAVNGLIDMVNEELTPADTGTEAAQQTPASETSGNHLLS